MTFLDELIRLGRALGNPANDLCICAEGNVSGSEGEGTLWIKASGARLATIEEDGFVQVEMAPVLRAMARPAASESEVRETLDAARVGATEAIPSTETYMHAALIEATGAMFVAHSHPTPLLSLLCLPDAEVYARHRLFPDEIVLCGPAACFVPYAAPGLPLANLIQDRVARYRDRLAIPPKTIWLQNHGLICLGRTAEEALAASLMSAKAARVLLGALHTGQEIKWLTQREVDQIYHWPDEHYRQRKLFG